MNTHQENEKLADVIVTLCSTVWQTEILGT